MRALRNDQPNGPLVGIVEQEPGSPGALLLEIMQNADSTKPLVIFITGRSDCSASERHVIERFQAAGILVSDICCPLSKSYPFAQARDDVFATHVWFTRSQNIFDRSRIVFFGASIQGNLAAEAAIATGSPAVTWSAPLDLVHLNDPDPPPVEPGAPGEEERRSTSDDRDDLRARIAAFAPDRNTCEEASPAYHVHPDCGALYLVNSLSEVVPATHALHMHAALTNASVPATLQFIRGSAHAYAYLETAIEQTVHFIQTATRTQTARS
jgi:acetyl esterase